MNNSKRRREAKAEAKALRIFEAPRSPSLFRSLVVQAQREQVYADSGQLIANRQQRRHPDGA